MKYCYDVEIGQRNKLQTGSVRYPVKVICEEKDELIVDTTYTVSKRQEENLEKMVKQFAEKKAKEFEQDKGQDHSNKNLRLE